MIVLCSQCYKEFDRPKHKIIRNLKRKTANYCSRDCQDASKLNEYSMFVYHLYAAERRCKKNGKPFDLTKECLKALWEKQGGICPYTGWKLENPMGKKRLRNAEYHPARASLDRIDSSRGYVPDNIEFVSLWVQTAKSIWSKEQFIEYCKNVTTNLEAIGAASEVKNVA